MLLEIHTLQNHAPSNLNRDDTGSPKDCIFGGTRRARISSQCIKRSIRVSKIFKDAMKGIGEGTRTRLVPRLVKNALLKNGVPEEVAIIAMEKATGIGKKDDGKEMKPKKSSKSDDTKKKSTKKPKEKDKTQIIFLATEEIESIVSTFVDAFKGCKTAEEASKISMATIMDSIKDLGDARITPDIAMFGRMITSDAFRNIEASVQVAHAISINKLEREFDYFTAVDDYLNGGKDNDDGDEIDVDSDEDEDDENGGIEGQGAGHLGDIEFNSSCYYKYVSIDIDSLYKNLESGSRKMAPVTEKVVKKTIEAFLKSMIFVTPSGKQNTFAAHQLPSAILVEVKPEKIPVSYANAFLRPSHPSPDGKKDIVDDGIEKLAFHVKTIADKFVIPIVSRFWFSTREGTSIDGSETVGTVPEIIEKVLRSCFPSKEA